MTSQSKNTVTKLFLSAIILQLVAGEQIQSEQEVASSTYSLRFPKSWHVNAPDSFNITSGCNKKSARCTGNGGGFPLPGVVFIFVGPSESTPGLSSVPHSVDEIVQGAGSKFGTSNITDVTLDSPDGIVKKAKVARTLWKPGNVWDEVYGVEVESRLFRAWVQYNDEPARIAAYRAAVIKVLSSIKIQKNALQH